MSCRIFARDMLFGAPCETASSAESCSCQPQPQVPPPSPHQHHGKCAPHAVVFFLSPASGDRARLGVSAIVLTDFEKQQPETPAILDKSRSKIERRAALREYIIYETTMFCVAFAAGTFTSMFEPTLTMIQQDLAIVVENAIAIGVGVYLGTKVSEDFRQGLRQCEVHQYAQNDREGAVMILKSSESPTPVEAASQVDISALTERADPPMSFSYYELWWFGLFHALITTLGYFMGGLLVYFLAPK